MHANNFIADKENSAAIQDLTTLANLHQDQNYKGLDLFHIPFIKICSSVWTLFIDCTGIEKIRWAEKLRIKNQLRTALEVVQKDIMDIKVHDGLSTCPVGALPFKAGEHDNLSVSGILVPLTYSILFTLIIT